MTQDSEWSEMISTTPKHRMTVEELITILEKYPQSMPVYLRSEVDNYVSATKDCFFFVHRGGMGILVISDTTKFVYL